LPQVADQERRLRTRGIWRVNCRGWHVAIRGNCLFGLKEALLVLLYGQHGLSLTLFDPKTDCEYESVK